MTDSNETLPENAASPLLLAAVVVLSFLGLSVATLALPHDPYIRYQQLSDTMHEGTITAYERLHFDDTPIDIAIIGNSRLRSGVMPELLSSELEEKLGRPINAVNISMAQEGRNAHFSLAQELLETHPETQLILLSAIEQMPREGHPSFRNIADSGDVLRAPVLVNRTYLDDLVFLPFRQMSLFVKTLMPQTFGVHAQYDPASRDALAPENMAFSDVPAWERAEGAVRSALSEDEIRAAARARVTGINPQLLPEWGADYEFAHERSYTQQIADLAAGTGTRLGFVYLPIFENPEPLRQESYYQQLGPVFSATFIAEDFPLFRDYGHLNSQGSQILTRWLADELLERQALETIDGPEKSGVSE